MISLQRHVDSEPAHLQHQVGQDGEGRQGRVDPLHPQQEGQKGPRGHVHHTRRDILPVPDEVAAPKKEFNCVSSKFLNFDRLPIVMIQN